MSLTSQKRLSVGDIAVVSAGVLSTTACTMLCYFIHKKNRFGPTEVCSKAEIKVGFSAKKVPKALDVIIIGSGMGGMALGSVLSKRGKKVLVLEQHDVAGGNTHTFEEDGFEFDTGLHYVGGMSATRRRWLGFTTDVRRWFDYITNNNVEWEKMEEEFDVAIAQGESFSILADWSKLIPKLKAAFPDETKAIDKHFQLARREEIITVPFLAALRLLPKNLADWVLRFARNSHLYRALFQQTTQQVLDSLTSNKKLQGILSYCYGDYGETPSRGSFMVNSMLWSHFQEGGYYPVGGPSVIAQSIVPVIEKSGGKVLVRAPVSSILIDENNRAIGVEVKGHKICAPIVVSTVGAPKTYTQLIPESHRHLLSKELLAGLENSSINSKVSLMSAFVGLEGTAEELKLEKRNYWIFRSWDHEANWRDYEQDRNRMPAVFISFSSAKDPTYAARHPNKQVALVIAPSLFGDVEEFSSNRVKHRGKEYEAKKSEWQRIMMEIFLKQFPHLESKISYVNVGTAVSNDFYLGTHRGAVYGLGHTPQRFQQSFLHPKTPIKNLYLSGQDVVCCGIAGAMAGGLMTACVIDKTMLFTLASIAVQS